MVWTWDTLKVYVNHKMVWHVQEQIQEAALNQGKLLMQKWLMAQMEKDGLVVRLVFYHCLGSCREEERWLLPGTAAGNWACLTNKIAQFSLREKSSFNLWNILTK